MFKEAAAAADVWTKGLFISFFSDETEMKNADAEENMRGIQSFPKPWVNMQRSWLALRGLCINDDLQIWKLRIEIDAESIWLRAARENKMNEECSNYAQWLKLWFVMWLVSLTSTCCTFSVLHEKKTEYLNYVTWFCLFPFVFGWNGFPAAAAAAGGLLLLTGCGSGIHQWKQQHSSPALSSPLPLTPDHRALYICIRVSQLILQVSVVESLLFAPKKFFLEMMILLPVRLIFNRMMITRSESLNGRRKFSTLV